MLSVEPLRGCRIFVIDHPRVSLGAIHIEALRAFSKRLNIEFFTTYNTLADFTILEEVYINSFSVQPRSGIVIIAVIFIPPIYNRGY